MSVLIILASVERLQYILKCILLVVNQSNYCFDSNFPMQSSGYWVAKRRQDVYTSNRTVCLQSPFVWVKDNTTNGLLPEQSWESKVWFGGQPDCSINSGLSESCCEIDVLHGFKLNDVVYWHRHCPICQMDAN
jgi:hypothetical protein